jgi:cell division protein FtsL
MVETNNGGIFFKWPLLISILLAITIPFSGTFLYIREAVSVMKVQIDHQNRELSDVKDVIKELTKELREGRNEQQVLLNKHDTGLTLLRQENKTICERLFRLEKMN